MKRKEQCIPWNPIPREVNYYMEVNLLYLEQMALASGMPLSVIVVSRMTQKTANEKKQIDVFWRIIFERVCGFRFRSIAQSQDISPIIAPKVNGKLEVACWEIVHSWWLPEAIGTLHSHPNAVHHYVIASETEIYDIAAEAWEAHEVANWDKYSQALQSRWEH